MLSDRVRVLFCVFSEPLDEKHPRGKPHHRIILLSMGVCPKVGGSSLAMSFRISFKLYARFRGAWTSKANSNGMAEPAQRLLPHL